MFFFFSVKAFEYDFSVHFKVQYLNIYLLLFRYMHISQVISSSNNDSLMIFLLQLWFFMFITFWPIKAVNDNV